MSELWWSGWWRIRPQLTCRSSLHSVQITIWGSVLSPTLYMSSPCAARGSSEWAVLHYRSGCSTKKVWGKHTAVTPAKGLSLFTAAPGSKRAMQPATPPGRGVVVNSALFPVWDVTWRVFLVNLRSAPMDTNLLSNIHKLFSERIDIFSSVEFNKVRSCASCSLTLLKMYPSHPRRSLQVSVMTGIIKISLKTFLECVRLRTFGRYGLQQIQVDCHYLQMYLWRFVSDENLVHFLLDEIMGSSAHRCLDPVPMEQSVIEVICERGWDESATGLISETVTWILNWSRFRWCCVMCACILSWFLSKKRWSLMTLVLHILVLRNV